MTIISEEKRKWNLDDILNLDKFDGLFSEVESSMPQYDVFLQKMNPDMSRQEFKEFMDFDEKMERNLERLCERAGLMEAADQKSEIAKLLKGRSEDLSAKLADASRKINHWLKGKEIEGKQNLDDANARRLFNSVPDLAYVLMSSRDSAKYTLSEPEEKIIAKKDINGVNVLVNLRTLIATEFNYAFEPKGAESKIINTSSELDAYRYSSNSGEREAAFLAQLGKYEQNLDKFFSIYQAVVKDWNDEVKWRGFSSPISMRNHENNIPDKAIETLLEACSENVEVFQNHFKWKAGQLGVDKLRRFDIYALLEKENVKVPFNKAVKMVLETLNNFSPPFAEKAKMIVDANHIDSHPDEVKEGGAFAASMTPDIIPYIFLNHNDTPRDVSVLAHELGHGIHFLYSSNHSIKSHNAPLPLAETASTFSEMIMFEELLKNAPNDFARKSMLSEKMDESYATVMRQNYFVKFEIEAHRAIPQGITAKQLSDIYFKTLEEQFGDSLDIDPIFRYEWANIPHIVHTPFYCYAYNFGELLSLSLFSRYKNEGRSFIPKIEKILSYGGSENPQKILNEIGVDINSKEFWQGSFDIIKNWQKKLEKY